MIELKKACRIAKEQMNNMRISSIIDVGNSFVFSFADIETDESPDISPIAVDKNTGDTSEYFPPDHIDELENGIEIEVPAE